MDERSHAQMQAKSFKPKNNSHKRCQKPSQGLHMLTGAQAGIKVFAQSASWTAAAPTEMPHCANNPQLSCQQESDMETVADKK